MKNAEGTEISLRDYEGKVILIINSATQCGFTPQYDGLQDLYERYGDEGFVILDFPCNQFGHQAPGSDEEIALFCDSTYGITFPIFSKIEVNGSNESPLYTYLKSQKGFAGFDPEHPLTPMLESALERTDANYAQSSDIKWNFTKFLIDREGNVVERFEPTTDILIVEQRILSLLRQTNTAQNNKYDCLKLENQLCFPLYACSKEVIRRYKPFLDRLDLTYTQYIAMMVMWERKEVTVKELGECLYLDSGTLTPLLKKLEEKRYVVRNRSKEDERNLIVSITQEGEDLKEQAVCIPAELSACVDMQPKEAQQLYRLLYKLLDRLS